MKRHRHSTVLEWYASSGAVSYIHLDRVKVRVQHRYVVNVSESIRYRGAVTSANREGSQQRGETVTNYARLHDVYIDVDGIEPLIHVHHVFGLFTIGVRTVGSLFERQNHASRRRETDVRST